jgi:hypothetical protein
MRAVLLQCRALIPAPAGGWRTRLEIAPTGEAFDYRYDAVGNRKKRRVNGQTREFNWSG